MLDRASHVFIGVIEGQQIESWPFMSLKIPGDEAMKGYWKILRRRVRVETIIRGIEPRKVIDIYEIFWTNGTTGDWNSTHEGERALFMLRVEEGRYHVVRDWWRSIFPITTGPHARLPLDESHPLVERIGLLNFWMESSDATARIEYPYFRYNYFDRWRTAKLERGLVRHPSSRVRVPACRELLRMTGWDQDECWEMLSESERAHLTDGGSVCCTAASIAEERKQNKNWTATRRWQSASERDERRLLTTVRDRKLRIELCNLYVTEYPGDPDNGCPGDQPPPATIVTERGEEPLLGNWPR